MEFTLNREWFDDLIKGKVYVNSKVFVQQLINHYDYCLNVCNICTEMCYHTDKIQQRL